MRIDGVAMYTRDSEKGGCYGSDRAEIVEPGASGEAVFLRGGTERLIQGTLTLRDNRRLRKQDRNKKMETDGRKR